MKNQQRRWNLLFFAMSWILFCLLFLSSPIIAVESNGKKTVFILHSYEKNHVCGQPQHDGVISALKKAGYVPGKNLDVEVYYMDTKRKNISPELMERQARIALKKIRQFHPDVLVTLDDNAFRLVALRLVDSDTAIVFSGLNGQPEVYHKMTPFMDSRQKPGSNITGVYEKLHILDALRVHSRIFKGTQAVWFIVDTSPTGNAIEKQIRIELGEKDNPFKYKLVIVDSWEAYCHQIFLANENPSVSAIYPVALLLTTQSGKVLTAPEIFNWTISHSKKPEIALNYAFTRMGLFGGAAVDFFAMGKQAGEKVVKILNGKDPGDIPIEDAKRYALVFNLKRANQLNIWIPDDIIMAADEVIRDDNSN